MPTASASRVAELMKAVREDNADEIARLYYLRLHPDTLAVGDMMKTSALDFAVLGRKTKALEALLKYGANPDGISTLRQTPLYDCLNSNDLECARILIKHGANVNATRFGMTILQSLLKNIAGFAEMRMYRSRLEALSLLLDSGADVNLHSASTPSPLTLAIQGNLTSEVKLLLAHNATVGEAERTALAGASEKMRELVTHARRRHALAGFASAGATRRGRRRSRRSRHSRRL